MINIGINGFGRIGRLILRAILENYKNKINVVAINDLGSIETNAHLIKYDSTHGIIKEEIETSKDGFKVGSHNIKVFAEKDPSNIPWGKVGADIVLECTGIFLDKPSAEKHIKGGAKKVIISAPAKEVDATIVYGVNHDILNESHTVISNASCTTNCLATLINNIHKEFTIKSGLMTTIHAFTNDQVLTDVYHSDLRRARSATQSMIPTKTGAASAVGLVLPDLEGKLDGFAIRVPTINVSIVDLCFNTLEKTSIDKINSSLLEASQTNLKGILGYTSEPLVSTDFNHTSYSSVYDESLTREMDGDFIKICAWYDNEWGFSNRMLDVSRILKQNA